jgi:hypothetical protein
VGHSDGSRVLAALRFGDDELPADELDRVVLVEGAQVHEPLVFHAFQRRTVSGVCFIPTP